jgi:hypothetical protein
MGNRINTFLLKRSSIPGKIPSPGQLLLGEIALNSADAILYTSGTTANSILPIGWDRISRTGDTMSGALYAPSISATTYLNLPISIVNNSNLFSTGLIDTGTNVDSTIYSIFFGEGAGSSALYASDSNFMGYQAGYEATNANDSNFIGHQAGYGAINSNDSNFIGTHAGSGATNAHNSNFIGNEAGNNAISASDSNFMGHYAGQGATNAFNSNFIGESAGYNAIDAHQSNFMGNEAGVGADNADFSNFMGQLAGGFAINAGHSNFIGQNAGYQATDASYSNFLGYNTGNGGVLGSLGSNNIIIGTNISLSAGTTDSMNIGGVLFGTGTYSDITGNPSIVAQTGGKIGINVVNPLEALHVNGNTLVDGNLTASTISATTYYNLPLDIKVTGSSFNNSTYDLTLTRNDGVSLISNLSILSSDMVVTGGTYNINTGVVTFTNNSGGTFNVTGFTSGMTDTYTTGGTYYNGTTTFTKTNGGTYTVSGYTYIPHLGYNNLNSTIWNYGFGGNVNNISFGENSLISNTSGEYNSAFGSGVLTANTTGSDNTGVGNYALNSNITGEYNTGIGSYSLYSNTSGVQNFGIGSYALYDNTTGSYNTGIGVAALQDNTVGERNVAIGGFSMYRNIGSRNIAIGFYAGSATKGSDNILLGANAVNSTDGVVSGSNNTIIGTLLSGVINGSNNTIFGKPTGLSSTTTNNIVIADGSGNIRFRDNNINTILPRLAGSGNRMVIAGPNGELSTTTIFDTFVTGGTYSTGTAVFTNNTGGTFSVTGFSTSTGNGTTFTGGTVSGATIFTNGLTANTFSATSINRVDYIVFNTGTTNPNTVPGTIYYDNTEKALSYNTSINEGVTVNLGQQLYTRAYNNSGVQLDKGTVVSITGTTNGVPSIIKAINSHTILSPMPIGLAAETIPNNSFGLVINNGILSGITINTFNNGDALYLSPFSAGTYINNTTSFPYSARTNQIGYVLQTGITTGKIYVNMNIENRNLSLTDIERNILEGNVISNGAYEYTGATTASSTTVNVSFMRGWIVNNTYTYATIPDVISIYYTGGTNISITNIATADSTYLLVNSASTLYQKTTFPTPQERRENIFLGKVNHPNRSTILNINNTVDYDVSPMSSLRDLWSPIKLINQGIIPSPNGANLSFNTSAGVLWGNGINWHNNQLSPNNVSIAAKVPASFNYRTRTGGTSTSVSVIDPRNYDVGGVITSIGNAGIDDATNQRIYLYPTGVINILYGQTKYVNLAAAVAAIQSETFIPYPNAESNGILIGVLSVRNDIGTDGEPLTNTNYAKFTLVSKFGESFGGTGGLSTTTLQQAYDNSSTPEIIINATLDGLSIQNGTGNADNITRLLEGSNAAGNVTSFIRADGYISGTTFQTNSTFLNNGGLTSTTVSATTIKTPSVTANETGLSANTISATTYYNLPTDIRVTGGTYSTGTAVFTNNTGGTFSVTGFSTSTGGGTFTGGTVSGPTTFTGGLSANTISATTYLGLPITIVNSTNLFSTGLIGTGVDVTGVTESNFLGSYAGYQSNDTNTSNFIGFYAGYQATSVSSSNFFGSSAGYQATNASSSNFFGNGAGYQATGVTGSNFFGPYAGESVYGGQGNYDNDYFESNFFGPYAGSYATHAWDSNFIGSSSGQYATDAKYSNFFGYQAGQYGTNAQYSNFIGYGAGYQATNAISSNFFGVQAGTVATNAAYSNFFGVFAGYAATNASYSNFIGNSAGYYATGASYSTLIGYKAGYDINNGISTIGSNNIIIGTNISLAAGTTNAINLGGVLFGTGTYSNIGGNPSLTPNNGNIGVNVVNPTQALHVSGNTLIQGGLTANTISATTYYNLPSSTFTGGTVNGSTIFTNGLSASTFSATTYYNLPTDIKVTGGTYDAGTAVFTNNTGGTFSVTGFSTSTGNGTTFTGGTVSGATTFTNGLSANTISATTYLNLPPSTFNGGTVTGPTTFTNGLTANTFSATTIEGGDLDFMMVSLFRTLYNY